MYKRAIRDNFYLLYKNILNIFLEEDRLKIINLLLLSARILIIIPLVSFTITYTFLGVLYSSNVMESILFTGLISSIHTLVSNHFKYSYRSVTYFRRELRFLLRLLPRGKEHLFIIKKISLDLCNHTFIYSILPYSLSVLILILLGNQSLGILLFGLLLVILNYMLGLSSAIFKITNFKSRTLKHYYLLLIGMFAALLIIFVKSLDINRISQMRIGNIREYLFIFEKEKLSIEVFVLCLLILSALALVSLYLYFALKKKAFIQSIFFDKEREVQRLNWNKIVYQRLLLRGFYSKNKVLKLRIGSILTILLIVLFYPILDQNNTISLVVTILFFCYSPSLFNLIFTHYLYNEILQKNFITTTYYYLIKFRCQKYVYKHTIFATLSQSMVLILPLIVILVLFNPIHQFLAMICYFLNFLSTILILATRIYNIGIYNFEQIKSLDPSLLTSKSTENFLVFGIPIMYAIPLIVLEIAQSNLLYTYICILCYTTLLIIYSVAKIYFTVILRVGGRKC